MSAARIALSRHGQTVWHAENRYAGISDVDLTETGRRQAQDLAQWTVDHRPDAIFCSPVRRARETAAPSERVLGRAARIIPGLRELDFGIAEGHTLAELAERDPALVRRFQLDPVANAFPEGESPAAAAARGAAALREVAGLAGGGFALVVAHNTLLRLALCELLEIPIARYRQHLPRLDTGTVTELSISADGAALLSFNVPISAHAG
jgi:probable phosphoglycerate mutase